MPLIGKLVVCGVGLIGGSFALALRRAQAVGRVVGIGRRREPLERARALGVIDEIIPEPVGGAHRNPQETILAVKKALSHRLKRLTHLSTRKLLQARFEKYSSMGSWKT